MSANREKPTIDLVAGKTNSLIYGTSKEALSAKDEALGNLVKNSIKSTINKLSFETTATPMDYFNQNTVNQLYDKVQKNDYKVNRKTSIDGVRKAIEERLPVPQTANIAKHMQMENYRMMRDRIPELFTAKNIFKNAILSPDNFTANKLNISYGDTDDSNRRKVLERIKKIGKKYNLEDKVDKIVDEAISIGVQYTSVISINDDLNKMLTARGNILTEEALSVFDDGYQNKKLSGDQIKITHEEAAIINRYVKDSDLKYKAKVINQTTLQEEEQEQRISSFTEEELARVASKYIEENIIIKNKYSLIQESIDLIRNQPGKILTEAQLELIQEELSNKKKYELLTEEAKQTTEPVVLSEIAQEYEINRQNNLYLNGSDVRFLDQDKVVPLKVNDKVLGYYYIERQDNAKDYMTVNAGMGGNANSSSTFVAPTELGVGNFKSANNSKYNNMYGANPFERMRTGGDIEALANIFLRGLAKKVDREFIKHNKELKDIIYSLVKEKYILNKKVSFTFLSADEVIEVSPGSIYAGAEWFAKLYLTELTNSIVSSVGRAHDHRMIRLKVGLDGAMNELVQSAIMDWKTKEFQMSDVENSPISTLLRLSPGRFDDIFVPVENDEAGFEIDTLQGMDTTKSTELLDFIKNGMLNSINLPASLVDAQSEIDYAKTLALRNGNFVRDVNAQQRKIIGGIERIIRILYKNEYQYSGNNENREDVNPDLIKVSFTSPIGLDIQNISETVANTEIHIEQLVKILVYSYEDPKNSRIVFEFKKSLFKKMLPNIEWDEYEELLADAHRSAQTAITKANAKPKPEEETNPNSW